jgi:hypothetical protein
MRIGNAQSFVEFNFEEIVPEQSQRAGDTSCSVAVSCNGFAGGVESVWFARDDIKRFLSDLEAFEAQRQGSVNLLNMSSPSEYSPLRFEIFSVNRLGHLAVRADLLKISYGNNLTPSTISVSFAVDSGMLNSILEDFRELFNSTQRRL